MVTGLLQREDFRGLVEAARALQEEPPEASRKRLVILARQALERALAWDDDPRAALFVLDEEAKGRDPAATVADAVLEGTAPRAAGRSPRRSARRPATTTRSLPCAAAAGAHSPTRCAARTRSAAPPRPAWHGRGREARPGAAPRRRQPVDDGPPGSASATRPPTRIAARPSVSPGPPRAGRAARGGPRASDRPDGR